MRIIFEECKTDLLRTCRYKTGIISDVVVFTALLCFFFASNTGTSFQEKYQEVDYKTLLLLGYMAWTIASSALSIVTSQISAEVQRGTFYLKINSRYPLQIIYLGDLISSILIQIVIVAVYTVITHFIFRVDYFISPEVIFALIICSIGMYGIGLVIAGLSLFFKRVGSIIFLLQLTLLFVTDTVPTSSAVMYVTKFIPLTKCNEVIRNCFMGTSAVQPLGELIIYSVCMLLAGYLIFEFFLRKAKKKGNLLLY